MVVVGGAVVVVVLVVVVVEVVVVVVLVVLVVVEMLLVVLVVVDRGVVVVGVVTAAVALGALVVVDRGVVVVGVVTAAVVPGGLVVVVVGAEAPEGSTEEGLGVVVGAADASALAVVESVLAHAASSNAMQMVTTAAIAVFGSAPIACPRISDSPRVLIMQTDKHTGGLYLHPNQPPRSKLALCQCA